MMDEKFKLRIKHPSGAEFEAEGAHDFVLKEKESFLAELLSQAPAQSARYPALQANFAGASGAINAKQAGAQEFWQKVIGHKNNLFILKIKSPDISGPEAAFIIMAASNIIGEIKDYSAINLSKSLKTSGYMPQRLDRLLLNEIKAGNITASGTKRNRAYCLTPKGMQTAYLAAKKLIRPTEADGM